jgi:hypothetical protein
MKAKKLHRGKPPNPGGDTPQRQKWKLHAPLSLPAPGRDYEGIAYMVATALQQGGVTSKTNHRAILEFIKRMCEVSSIETADDLSALTGIATLATAYLMFTPRATLRVLARATASWPVLATTNLDWHARARNYLAAVELGADTIKGRISDLAYTPAGGGDWREWARCAVETMDKNRTTFQVRHFRRMASAGPKSGYFETAPAWALKCAELPPFTRKSAPQWAALARQMIREQYPDVARLIDNKAVQNLQRSLQGNRLGNVPPGVIRNKILDKIAGAILTISKEGPTTAVA